MSQLFTLMPILNLRVSRTTLSGRQRHSTVHRWASSYFPMIMLEMQNYPTKPCCFSCKPHTKLRQRAQNGIGMHWNANKQAVGISISISWSHRTKLFHGKVWGMSTASKVMYLWLNAILIECTRKGSGEDHIKIYSIDKDLNDMLNKDVRKMIVLLPILCRW